MKADGDVITMVDSGLFTLSKNPWESGKLASYAREYGFTIKTRKILKRTAPWAKARLHFEGMSDNQRQTIANFLNIVASGIEKDQAAGRKPKPASVYIKEHFKVRKPRVYVSKADVASIRELASRLLGMKAEARARERAALERA
jgi:hypothetical protein